MFTASPCTPHPVSCPPPAGLPHGQALESKALRSLLPGMEVSEQKSLKVLFSGLKTLLARGAEPPRGEVGPGSTLPTPPPTSPVKVTAAGSPRPGRPCRQVPSPPPLTQLRGAPRLAAQGLPLLSTGVRGDGSSAPKGLSFPRPAPRSPKAVLPPPAARGERPRAGDAPGDSPRRRSGGNGEKRPLLTELPPARGGDGHDTPRSPPAPSPPA